MCDALLQVPDVVAATVAACRGTVAPEQMRASLDAHLIELRARAPPVSRVGS